MDFHSTWKGWLMVEIIVTTNTKWKEDCSIFGTSSGHVQSLGQMHKYLCKHKGRKTHSHSFCQLYKTVCTYGSVLQIPITVTLGACVRASFPDTPFIACSTVCSTGLYTCHSLWLHALKEKEKSSIFTDCYIGATLQQEQEQYTQLWLFIASKLSLIHHMYL